MQCILEISHGAYVDLWTDNTADRPWISHCADTSYYRTDWVLWISHGAIWADTREYRNGSGNCEYRTVRIWISHGAFVKGTNHWFPPLFLSSRRPLLKWWGWRRSGLVNEWRNCLCSLKLPVIWPRHRHSRFQFGSVGSRKDYDCKAFHT